MPPASAAPAAPSACGRCLRQPPAHATALAAVDYDAPWDRLITRLKFHDGLDLAPVLADTLLAAIRLHRNPLPDWVLPAPLGPGRLRERGYNQAWEIARRVAAALGRPARTDLLLRPRDGERQTALDLAARAANVRDAYAVDPRRRALLAGRTVAVVDDVMTTGASAEAMARTLRAAGAASVAVWVVARTAEPG
ncbi:ComF family protein [Piscinibacter sakaiensis]|uniref:ComF family protein n=1 Tax=Piscinibacter sakaiensis TaxID=1547922 RepID=UPI0006B4B745|nr:phosphoribosyltransferase family protein [Piscinibacter sakaiensis]